MELFMKNIDFSLSKAQLIEEVASLLHQDPFTTTWAGPHPINFNVYLHRPRSFQIRTGTLTLPAIDIGERFLTLHASVRIGGRDVLFQRSRKPPRQETVERIRALPYINPYIEQRKESIKKKLDADFVPVSIIQFGWLCRDYAISVECEHRMGEGSASFDAKKKQVRVRVDQAHSIVIPSSTVNYLSASRVDHSLVFELNSPPSYEREPAEPFVGTGDLSFFLYDVRPQPRSKLSHLPIQDHERVAPYASLVVRLVCCSEQNIESFRQLCTISRFRKVEAYEYDIVRRNLFSESAILSVQASLEALTWPVAFQLESLLRDMAIDYVEARQLIPEIHRLVDQKGSSFAATSLFDFKNKVRGYFHTEHEKGSSFDIIRLFRRSSSQVEETVATSRRSQGDDSLYDSFHVEVSPTAIYLSGPSLERSNRVIRAYGVENQESFLRVSFVDEGGLHIRFDHEIDGREFVRARVGSILLDGLEIAGRKFEFLAYSQSALKEHSVWFVKPFWDKKQGRTIDAAGIIKSLGTFDRLEFDPELIRCPARYAARIAQAFTATEAVKVDVDRVVQIDDITTADRAYKFTDGVGTISNELRDSICGRLNNRRKKTLRGKPAAFQIRFRGSKGMVSVDHTLTGSVICLRPSMIKFQVASGQHNDIEIARAFDKPGPCFLNRPLIMLLDGLGVPFEVFGKYQEDAVKATTVATESLKNAASLLDTHGLGASYRLPSVLLNLDKLGIDNLDRDGFYGEMIEYAINHVLRDLKNHARIPVPGAWTLVGVADVHRCLRPNTIFACVHPEDGGRKYLSGPVLITRSPCIHPGDVMVVEAIGVPPVGSCFAEEPLVNTVVFSVQGERPVPSCLGGGDLDGDLYNLFPLSDPDYKELQLFVPVESAPPANYEAAERKTLDRPSTKRDIAEFFMEYISSDVVGIIATTWLIMADQSDEGIFDRDCIRLANLHSNAVDYPKSGQPVRIEQIPMLKHKARPDWNAPETVQVDYESGDYYKSQKVIGELFRSIELPIADRSGTLRRDDDGLHVGMKDVEELESGFGRFDWSKARNDPVFLALRERIEEVIGRTELRGCDSEAAGKGEIPFIVRLFHCYAAELREVCVSNAIRKHAQISEAEAVIGTVAQKSSQPRRRKQVTKNVRERTEVLVRGIREDLVGGEGEGEGKKGLRRAWIAWNFAMWESREGTFGAMSFGWIALGAVFEAIEDLSVRPLKLL